MLKLAARAAFASQSTATQLTRVRERLCGRRRADAFGIVTTRHGNLECRYDDVAAPGTTLVTAADSGLNRVDKSGDATGHIDAACAIDSTGAELPASYIYGAATHQLVVKADIAKANGTIFIDPSWRYWATASAIGLVWLVAAAGLQRRQRDLGG